MFKGGKAAYEAMQTARAASKAAKAAAKLAEREALEAALVPQGVRDGAADLSEAQRHSHLPTNPGSGRRPPARAPQLLDSRGVGRRKAAVPVILQVDATRAAADGVRFYVGNEKVWLADAVPARYLCREDASSTPPDASTLERGPLK